MLLLKKEVNMEGGIEMKHPGLTVWGCRTISTLLIVGTAAGALISLAELTKGGLSSVGIAWGVAAFASTVAGCGMGVYFLSFFWGR